MILFAILLEENFQEKRNLRNLQEYTSDNFSLRLFYY